MAKRIATNKADILQQKVEGERSGVDLDRCDWLDATLVKELKEAIRDRAKIKRQEDVLGQRKEDANQIIESMMGALGIDTAYIRSVGSVAQYSQDRRSLNQDLLKEELLKAGLPAETVVKCFAKATRTSTYKTVRFTSSSR